MSGQAHRFDPAILRDYDIRGVVGRNLRIADAVALGMAFGSTLVEKGGRNVVVGRDGRLSSPDLAEALLDGLTATGVDVWRIGCGPTPMLHFAVAELGADAGIMVTASHNPANHNGFKMTLLGKPFFGPDIRALGRRAEAGKFVSGEGSVEKYDVSEAYVARLLKGFRAGRDLHAVWDCGSGATGPTVKALVQGLPGRHTVLFDDVDGAFPHHHPDPTVPENLAHLIAAMQRTGADVGFAFDGDGDRIGVVDDQGEILWGDRILALLAADVLARHPGATILGDVKASRILFDEIRRLGGNPVMTRSGHSVIRTRLAQLGAPLAGEMSGHIFYGDDYYGYDDGLYAAVRLLEALGARKESLAAWHGALPRLWNTPEIRIPCDDETKFAVVDAIAAALNAEGVGFNDIDGVRVDEEFGWWLVRASNTQAELVIRCEATTLEGLGEAKARLAARLQAAGMAVPEALR